MSIPAKDTHLAALNHYLRAVTIVFDFMNPVLDRKTGALMALRTTLHRPARVSVEPQANAKVGWGAAQSTMLDLIVVPRVSTIVWVVGNNGLSAASHFQGACVSM
jgi:hypothetical protein